MHDLLTISLDHAGTIDHVVNDTGGPVTQIDLGPSACDLPLSRALGGGPDMRHGPGAADPDTSFSRPWCAQANAGGGVERRRPGAEGPNSSWSATIQRSW